MKNSVFFLVINRHTENSETEVITFSQVAVCRQCLGVFRDGPLRMTLVYWVALAATCF